jgi:hypothetical protein
MRVTELVRVVDVGARFALFVLVIGVRLYTRHVGECRLRHAHRFPRYTQACTDRIERPALQFLWIRPGRHTSAGLSKSHGQSLSMRHCEHHNNAAYQCWVPLRTIDKLSAPLNTPMPMMTNVDQIVAALGGARQVARWAGISVPAVYGWQAEGYIPRQHGLAVYLAARRRGLEIDIEALFGVTEDGEYVSVRTPLSAHA